MVILVKLVLPIGGEWREKQARIWWTTAAISAGKSIWIILIRSRNQPEKYSIGSKADPNPIQNCSEAINKMAEIKRVASTFLPPNEAHDKCCSYHHSLDRGDNCPFDLVLEEIRKCLELKESIDYLRNSKSSYWRGQNSTI